MAARFPVHACVSVFMHDSDVIDVFGNRFVCVGSCVCKRDCVRGRVVCVS